jgi:hypothetical protein
MSSADLFSKVCGFSTNLWASVFIIIYEGANALKTL